MADVDVDIAEPSENPTPNTNAETNNEVNNQADNRNQDGTRRTPIPLQLFRQPNISITATNNNTGELPQQTQNLYHMRDRLFLALFFRVSLVYARAFPVTFRRILEFFLLLQSLFLLFILIYIHFNYTKDPITCLDAYKETWPRDGILRVEITTESPENYSLKKSYEKELKVKRNSHLQFSDDIFSMMLSMDLGILFDGALSTAGSLISTVTHSDQKGPTEEIKTDSNTDTKSDPTAQPNLKPNDDDSLNEDKKGTETKQKVEFSGTKDKKMFTSQPNDTVKSDEETSEGIDAISPSFKPDHKDEPSWKDPSNADLLEAFENADPSIPDSPFFNKSLEEIEMLKMEARKNRMSEILKPDVSEYDMFSAADYLDEQPYIVEYALEQGFLRLSAETRERLNIPVKIVLLNPENDTCFGGSFSHLLLENFLGYENILMSSIKTLVGAQNNKGYIRNVITEEQFKFVPMLVGRYSYFGAFLVMLIFTVSISILLRYSHHQIFIFIVDLLNNIEGTGTIHIPAAPLFTVILALVGMEAIMAEFFNDTSTAFYVILIVWIADQYDNVCSHTYMTKSYWLKFFYLYHFSFYAYHQRFNGQCGGLALLVSWSFIQHSMVYFYHHCELPAILRQANLEPGAHVDILETDVPIAFGIQQLRVGRPSTLTSASQTRAPPAGQEQSSQTSSNVRDNVTSTTRLVTNTAGTSTVTVARTSTSTSTRGAGNEEGLVGACNVSVTEHRHPDRPSSTKKRCSVGCARPGTSSSTTTLKHRSAHKPPPELLEMMDDVTEGSGGGGSSKSYTTATSSTQPLSATSSSSLSHEDCCLEYCNVKDKASSSSSPVTTSSNNVAPLHCDSNGSNDVLAEERKEDVAEGASARLAGVGEETNQFESSSRCGVLEENGSGDHVSGGVEKEEGEQRVGRTACRDKNDDTADDTMGKRTHAERSHLTPENETFSTVNDDGFGGPAEHHSSPKGGEQPENISHVRDMSTDVDEDVLD